MMAAAASRSTLQCNTFMPYLNLPTENETQALHLQVLEFNFLLAAVCNLLVALRRRRLGAFLGVLLLGVVMETVGFFTKSHTHVEFHFMLTCYLSLKEMCWYLHTLFSAIILVQEFWFKNDCSVMRPALAVALISLLQDAPYEMTNALPGVGAVYINREDFYLGDLAESLNSGSSMVMCSFFLLSLSAGWIACKFSQNEALLALLLPLGTMPVLVLAFTPLNIVKYAGCMHLLPSRSSIHLPSWEDVLAFQMQCIGSGAQFRVKTNPLLLFGLVLSLLIIFAQPLPQQPQPPQQQSDWTTIYLLMASALACHTTFLYHAFIAQRDSVEERVSSIFILFSLAMAHLGLLRFIGQMQQQQQKSKYE